MAGKPVTPQRVQVAAAPAGGDAAKEAAELRQRLAKLTAELEAARMREAELKAKGRSWTRALKQVLTFGALRG
ncbi:MAG: hypothetical protein WAT39_11990 [Planctomycetota bacterium]